MTSIDFIILHLTHHLYSFIDKSSLSMEVISINISRASAKADCKASGLAVRRDAKAQGRKDTERAVEKASGSTV
jgi:hypothetical protein